MMENQSSLTILVLCIFVLLGMGLASLSWGNKLPGKGSWMVWAGFLFILSGIGVDTGLFLKEEFKVKSWISGWVWPRDQISAITVGVLQDILSLTMTILTILIASVLLVNQTPISREPRPERIHAATAISVAGVIVSWNALTPWMGLVGLMLSLIGGFIAFGSRWDSNNEAKLAAQFIFERSAGLILSLIGVCVLLTSRSALNFIQVEGWFSQPAPFHATWMGALLVVMGLFVQMQPFPMLAGLTKSSVIYPSIRILLNQIFPAWAAFALLLRLQPEFVQLGLFPAFGWFALVSTFLSLLSGLFQDDWRRSLATWLASGFSLSCALLAFTGPLAAMGILLGMSFGCLCFSGAAVALEGECPQTNTNRKRALWLKAVLSVSVAAGTGVIGFVSATGGVRWITQAIVMAGGVAGVFILVFFLYVLLGWKLAWRTLKTPSYSDASWVTILSLIFCLLPTLGLLWTGSVTGEVTTGINDHIMESLFKRLFGAQMAEMGRTEDSFYAASLYWGTLLVAFTTAYWTAGRKEDQWEQVAKFFPKTTKFLAQGYGVSTVAKQGIDGISGLGKLTEKLVDQQIWSNWIPRALSATIKTATLTMNAADKKITANIGSLLRKSVEVPAKILQLVQTGDVRWYLLFALSSGFALLSHFLKT